MIQITVCKCGHYDVPVLDRCVNCGQPVRTVSLEARGKVLTWTVLYNVPEGLPRPLRLFLVELSNGMKMLCRGTAACEAMGQPVRIREDHGIFHCDPWDRWADLRGKALKAAKTLRERWEQVRPLSAAEREAARRSER